MQHMHFSRPLRIAAIAMMISLLAACGGRDAIKNGTTTATNVPNQFDVTLEAAKDGQFDLEGATLTRQDLGSHIRYLAEVNKPVHTMVLQRGEKQNIKDQHVTALASVCRDAKITCYVRQDDGTLKVIQVVE
ncbi:MAG: hypothetical protein ABI304_07540 [Rudaea sp.]